MNLSRSSWLQLSAYLFIDKKLDISSSTGIQSRFNNLVDFIDNYELPFSRSSVNKYLQYKKEQGCKNTYLNNIIKVVKYVHEWLMQEYNYDSNCNNLTYFKEETYVYDILTPSEVESIYSLEVPYSRLSREINLKYQTVFMMLSLTGMRVNEAMNLTWSDITEESIHIQNTKTNVDRIIPNNSMLYKKLLKYRQICRNDNQYIFQGKDKEHLPADSVRFDLKKRVEILGIKKRVWIHLFRHSFCVEMLRHNDVTLVAKLMGHSDMSSTLSYSHYLLDDMKNAIMTHSLLREVQPFDVITERIREFVDTVVDKEHNTVHIESGKDTFSICVKR